MGGWFEDEAFWAGLYPFLFCEERLGAAEKEVDGLLSLAPNRGAEVLDLCCGPGRHAVVLACRGMRVTGVDGSGFLLEKARERAAEAGVEIEWVHSDMRAFARPESFDLAMSMFSSFGYFDDPQDDLDVLRNVHASLRPGGALVMEMASKEWLAQDFQSTTSEVAPDGTMLVQRHEVVEDWGRIANEWTLVRDGGSKRFEFRVRVYSGQELKEVLGRAGFARIRLHGDLDGEEYGYGAKRLVAVAVKDGDE